MLQLLLVATAAVDVLVSGRIIIVLVELDVVLWALWGAWRSGLLKAAALRECGGGEELLLAWFLSRMLSATAEIRLHVHFKSIYD